MSVVVDYVISEKTRKHCVNEFAKIFNRKTAVSVEKGLYMFIKSFTKKRTFFLEHAESAYKDKMKDIIFNFEQKGPTVNELLEMIDNDEFNPYNIAFLKADELNKDAWSRIVLRMKLTQEQLNNLPTVTWKKCDGCRSKEYFMYQLQTRSIDEPMTTFYSCKQCGKNYYVNQ